MLSTHYAGSAGHPDGDTGNDSPGGAIKPPDFAPPAQGEQVSGSVPPPQANSLQFKAGGLGVALSNYRGTLPLPDFIGRANLLVAAHRVGYAGSGLLGNATRVLAGLGQLFDPYAPADTQSTVLRTVKALGNAAGYAIDFSRVDDKRAAARNYLCAPRQQGGYVLTGATRQDEPVILRALRIRPRNAATQTGVPTRGDASTQTGAHTKDAGAQIRAGQAASATQTPPPAYGHSGSQAGPVLRAHGTQTRPDAREGAAQTDASRLRRAVQGQAPDVTHAPAVAPRYVDRSVQIGATPGADATVQSTAGRVHRGTLAVSPGTAAATQTAVPDRVARGSQCGRERGDAAVQADPPATDRATQTGTATDAAMGSAPLPSTSERAVQTSTHSRSQTTQTHRAPLAEQGIQVVPMQAEKGSQAQVDNARAATQTIGPDTVDRSVQAVAPRVGGGSQAASAPADGSGPLGATPAVAVEAGGEGRAWTNNATQASAATRHHVAVQTGRQPAAGAGSQTSFDVVSRSNQTTLQTSSNATRTLDGKPVDAGSQTTASRSVKQVQAGAGELDTALRARQRLLSTSVRLPASVHGNAHWLPIDAVALASSGYNARRHAGPIEVAGVTSDAIGLAGDATATFNVNARCAFTVGAKALSLLSTAVGLAPSVAQLSSDVTELITHPECAQAKWNVANSALQLGAGLAAAAASFVFPPAALAPLLFPNVAEIGHALDLLRDEQTLRANGRTTEADAVHSKYVNAALDATPLVNWFSSFYAHGLRPEIERFELAQGNRPDGPPKGELPPMAHGDPRVADFYGQALQERMHVLEAAAKDYLQHVADTAQLDSVTLVSRSPQMFGWPATGQPMRVFDRAVVLTWSRETGTVHGMFFGKDADGEFRLPMLNEGVTTAAGKKNLVVVSDMLDSEHQPTHFDLAAFRADTSGRIRIYDPRGYAA
jgi:hypothetical protein